MYVFAGLVSAPVWLPVGMVYEYDPAANTWTKKKPMALPAHHSGFDGIEWQDLCVRRLHGGENWKPGGVDAHQQRV